jgi:hypothetical protein
MTSPNTKVGIITEFVQNLNHYNEGDCGCRDAKRLVLERHVSRRYMHC